MKPRANKRATSSINNLAGEKGSPASLPSPWSNQIWSQIWRSGIKFVNPVVAQLFDRCSEKSVSRRTKLCRHKIGITGSPRRFHNLSCKIERLCSERKLQCTDAKKILIAAGITKFFFTLGAANVHWHLVFVSSPGLEAYFAVRSAVLGETLGVPC